MRTPAAARDVKVTITGQVESVGPSTGYPIETFDPLPPDVWAARIPLAATEDMQAAQLTERNALEWRIPYRPDCDPDLVDVPHKRRLVCGGRVHDITSADLVDGRRLEIRLMTREQVTA